jgi:hypothetical protein
MNKKSETLTQEQKDRFIEGRDLMQAAYERMRKESTRPTYRDKGEPADG